MGGAANFVAQFFPIFLLGALFGKLMDDSGSVCRSRASCRQARAKRAILAVVLAGALVTYGGVSLFVVRSSCCADGQALFRAGRHPAPADAGGDRARHLTFTMSALPGTPAIQNAIPMPSSAPRRSRAGAGHHRLGVMLGFGMWWLRGRKSRAPPPARASTPPAPAPVADAAGSSRERAPTPRTSTRRARSTAAQRETAEHLVAGCR
jgi:H+/gluconate symporter-like permease